MVLVAADAPGAPCWLSLMTRDLQAAERFYGAVLGWTFRRGVFGRASSVAELDGVPVAGIGATAGESAVPVAWTVYFAVDDADAAVAGIRARGGTVGVGPVSYPPRGRAALATDPEGAAFGVWEGEALTEWRVGDGEAPAWVELHTRDAFDAAVFYGEVLEWVGGEDEDEDEDAACCEVSYEDDRVVLRRAGRAVARLNSGPVDATAARPQLRPHWLVHFKVPDLERARRAVVAHGGTVVPDEAGWGGVDQYVTVCDPDGGLFTLDLDQPRPGPGHRSHRMP
ncbi:VOC family protein [Streptomyces sp. NBC_01351]|uniref:VOC family protein n=1 Tax=Streptomyces sp. NBC_01351 TaxID=2903833 RepID=UPI002E34AC9B|nr:VOC family protein [Streptomyces sp. NBC_01351]